MQLAMCFINDTKTIKLNDQTKPVIGGVNFASDNSYADITFSVPVYSNNNGTGALIISFIIVFNQLLALPLQHQW